MKNFSYHNPTHILFGEKTISKISRLIPENAKVLMTYGGGSIFRNGVYDQVKNALSEMSMLEFGGIEANPTYETLMKAVDLVKQEGITFLLAVGGGSVIDGTKFIAAATTYRGLDPWDFLSKGEAIESALPFGCVLTLPATGSEMNSGAVISRKSSQEKLSFGSRHTFPQFSILDPKTTYSLPKKQIRNGIVDTFVHTMEQYLTFPVSTPLQDRQAEAILKTVIEESAAFLGEPKSYNAMATFMWSATQALNGVLGCGVVEDWATHMIGHEITAFYGLDHAETLAIVYPSLLRYKKDAKAEKLLQYGERIFGINGMEKSDCIEAAIVATEGFFHQIGMPTRLEDYQINAQEAAQKISARMAERKTTLGEHEDIFPQDVKKILLAA